MTLHGTCTDCDGRFRDQVQWRWLAGLLCALTLACAPEQQAPARASRPNIVMVLVDDLRADTLSCAGSTLLETPHIDRLASEGVFFENALVATSLCCPSRASLLTGKYPHITGVLNNSAGYAENNDPLSGHEVFPELLQQAGYETAYIGKWHLPNRKAAAYRGFDHWISFQRHGRYFDQELNIDGVTTPTRDYSTDVLAELAVEWILERGEEPFMLVLATKSCHHPFVPAPRHNGTLDPARARLPTSRSDPEQSLSTRLRRLRASPQLARVVEDPAKLRGTIVAYAETVLGVDDSVGRLVAALSERQLLDNTFVVVTSDNGLLLGEHGILHKMCTYEHSIRVPQIVRYPALIPAGTREARAVLNIDLTATLLDLAGVPVPAEMQGESFLPLLADPDASGREVTLHYPPAAKKGTTGEPMELTLRTPRWKYLRSRAPEFEEVLFDLAADPDERTNVAGDPARAADLEFLRAAMRAEMERLAVPAHWYADA